MMTPLHQETPLSNTIHDIDIEALEALIQRLNDAKQYNLTLSAEDIERLLSALATLSILQDNLSNNDVTIHKRRKLLGMVVASEKLSTLLNKKPKPASRKPKKKNTTETPVHRVEPDVVHHPLADLKKGDRCPACDMGTLSKVEPGVLLRMTGQSPYQAVKHVLERLRCNACGEYFTADLPDDVKADGEANQKYGYSARSLIAINKYYMGAPFYRQASLQDILGLPIAASTAFDQSEYLANDLQPVYQVSLKQAANAQHFHLDDTSHHIIDQKEIIKCQRKTNQPQKRTGT